MSSLYSSETSISGQILIVDDEPSVLAIASAILNTIEVTPLKARNGEDALATVQSHYASGQRIALVVLDLTMPGGMSGFETMSALREIDPEIRVIACSGFFQDDALDLCRSIGFSNILAKPYTPDSLLGIIRRTLNEAPPPISAAQPYSQETSNSSPIPFTPSASTPPDSAATSSFYSTQSDLDEEEDDEDEPLAYSPSQFAGVIANESPTSQPVSQVTPGVAPLQHLNLPNKILHRISPGLVAPPFSPQPSHKAFVADYSPTAIHPIHLPLTPRPLSPLNEISYPHRHSLLDPGFGRRPHDGRRYQRGFCMAAVP